MARDDDEEDLFPTPDKFTPEQMEQWAKDIREQEAEDAARREARRQQIASLPKREPAVLDPSASETPARGIYQWLQRRNT